MCPIILAPPNSWLGSGGGGGVVVEGRNKSTLKVLQSVKYVSMFVYGFLCLVAG